MNNAAISDRVRGKTIRLAWTDGPTKGTTQEHVFHDDGTVEWRDTAASTHAKPTSTPERVNYAGVDINDDACMISYLSRSGFTLTVALNFKDGSTVGVASNEKTWVPVRGRFELVH